VDHGGHSPTLGGMAKTLQAVEGWLQAIEGESAMALTPARFEADIRAAGHWAGVTTVLGVLGGVLLWFMAAMLPWGMGHRPAAALVDTGGRWRAGGDADARG